MFFHELNFLLIWCDKEVVGGILTSQGEIFPTLLLLLQMKQANKQINQTNNQQYVLSTYFFKF